MTGIAFVAAETQGPAGSGRNAAADACEHPYARSSPWNTRIGAEPRLDPAGTRTARAIEGPLTSDPTQYTYPVYEVDSRVRDRPVQVDGRFSHVTRNGRHLRIQKGGTARMPIPASAQAAAGSDGQIVIIDRETGDEWGAWRLRRQGGGWGIENGYRYNVRWSAVPPQASDGSPFGSRGAGVPYLAGLVRPCEIESGRIDHALAFAYDFPGPRHIYPATKSDGASDDPGALSEGTRLQLDPALPPAELQRMGCLDACVVIARALQDYGMYVIDNAGRPKVMLEYDGTADWGGRVDASTVSAIPLTAFRVIAPRDRGD
jgi:hypothetical protein